MLSGLPIFAVLYLVGCGGRTVAGPGGASDRGVACGDSTLQVVVESGTEWLHDFPLFLGLKRRGAASRPGSFGIRPGGVLS